VKEATCKSFHNLYLTILIARLENVKNKLYTDNFFSLPMLYDDVHTMALNCCRNATPNRKGMLKNFRQKIKLKDFG